METGLEEVLFSFVTSRLYELYFISIEEYSWLFPFWKTLCSKMSTAANPRRSTWLIKDKKILGLPVNFEEKLFRCFLEPITRIVQKSRTKNVKETAPVLYNIC